MFGQGRRRCCRRRRAALWRRCPRPRVPGPQHEHQLEAGVLVLAYTCIQRCQVIVPFVDMDLTLRCRRLDEAPTHIIDDGQFGAGLQQRLWQVEGKLTAGVNHSQPQ